MAKTGDKPGVAKPRAFKPKAGAKPKARTKPKDLVRALREAAGQAVLAGECAVLDRLWSVVMERRAANPETSHSARLLSRGTAKIAQKFGEEAVECLIEAVARNRDALVAESADVLYHLIVLWVDAGISPDEVWTELKLREGISGIAEKAARPKALPLAFGMKTTKIP